MKFLNLTDVVKLKIERENLGQSQFSVNDMLSTFISNCNKRLLIIDLQMSDFKNDSGKYEVTINTANVLIELEELELKHTIRNIVNQKYDSLKVNYLEKYFNVLIRLVNSHFYGKKKEMLLLKIQALEIELELNMDKQDIVAGFNEEDEMYKYLRMLDKNVSKIFLEIYSKRKYPYLIDDDRMTLMNELYDSLAGVVKNHYEVIKIANDIRNSDEEEFVGMSIEDIISNYGL